jgi:predicted dehydrogenase
VRVQTTRNGVLVGFGVIAGGHLEGYSRTTGLEISAIVDSDPRRRQAARSLWPGVEVCTTLSEALDRLDFDFVDVCTPPSSHLALIIEALQRDVPVICEKPLVLDLSEVSTLLAAQSSSSAWVHPCHNYLFAPGIQALTAAIRVHGGEFVTGRFRTIRPGHARGVAEWNPDWRRQSDISGGGILRDHGPHSVYLAQMMLGAEVTEVSCLTDSEADERWPDSEDNALLVLHTRSTAVEIELSWRGSARETAYEVETTAGHFRLEGDILRCDVGGRATSLDIESDFDDPRHAAWFREVFAEFERVLNGSDPPTRLADAISNVAVLDAAYHSASQGGRRFAVASHHSSEAAQAAI